MKWNKKNTINTIIVICGVSGFLFLVYFSTLVLGCCFVQRMKDFREAWLIYRITYHWWVINKTLYWWNVVYSGILSDSSSGLILVGVFDCVLNRDNSNFSFSFSSANFRCFLLIAAMILTHCSRLFPISLIRYFPSWLVPRGPWSKGSDSLPVSHNRLNLSWKVFNSKFEKKILNSFIFWNSVQSPIEISKTKKRHCTHFLKPDSQQETVYNVDSTCTYHNPRANLDYMMIIWWFISYKL